MVLVVVVFGELDIEAFVKRAKKIHGVNYAFISTENVFSSLLSISLNMLFRNNLKDFVWYKLITYNYKCSCVLGLREAMNYWSSVFL